MDYTGPCTNVSKLEFSQEHIGTQIFGSRELTEEQYFELFDKDNGYLKTWDVEQKKRFINTIDYKDEKLNEQTLIELAPIINKNTEEYINQLNLFISGFDSSKIKFSNDITNKLYELESAHMSKAINQDVSDCFSKINLKLEAC